MAVSGETRLVTERDGRTHTQGSDPRNGPDFCRECSDEAMGWVTWPCGYVRASDVIERTVAAILDIDAHADALGEDDDGFVTGGYLISIGSLHRALGVIGHTAPKCRDCGGHDQHELRDANYGMWNAMQRAANHPERWQDYIQPALNRYRAIASEREDAEPRDIEGPSHSGREGQQP